MNADRLLALYERIADAPDAVARLRRFILDLAVRGKLVPQDPADEPASELLKRIRQCVPPDQSRRINRPSPIGNSLERLSYDLPDGWAAPALNEIIKAINGRVYKQSELLSHGTPVLRVGNLFISNTWYYSDLALGPEKYCDTGDLIYPWSALFGQFTWTGPRVIYHYHIWKLNLLSDSGVSKRYIYLFLLQKTREIKEEGRGISMVHMTKEKMEKLVVPLPPHSEQQRIVAKVDELMGLCDRLEEARTRREADRDRLTTASLSRLTAPDTDAPTFQSHARFALDALPALTTRPDQIKALRQTILNMAVQGKLTRQNKDDGSAEVLLKDVLTSRPRVRRPVVECREQPFTIPGTWVWASLDQLITHGPQNGISPKPTVNPEAPKAITLTATTRGSFDPPCFKHVEANIPDESDFWLQDGDLLFQRGNTREYVGMAAIDTGLPRTFIFPDLMMKTRVSDLVNLRFIHMAAISPYARAYFGERATGAQTTMPKINQSTLVSLPVPLPPLAEQHRIVAKADQLMALCDQLEAALTAADTTRRRLLEALLHEALDPAAGALEAAQ